MQDTRADSAVRSGPIGETDGETDHVGAQVGGGGVGDGRGGARSTGRGETSEGKLQDGRKRGVMSGRSGDWRSAWMLRYAARGAAYLSRQDDLQ